MATYTKYAREVPSSQRAAVITNCVDGDRIDMLDVLGRPAHKVIFLMNDPTDTVTYRINNLRRLVTSRVKGDTLSTVDEVFGVFGREKINFWTVSDEFTGTGSTQLETSDGLEISSLEITGLTPSSGASITIEVH